MVHDTSQSSRQTLKAPFPWFGTIEVRADGSVWRVRSNGRPCPARRVDNPDGSKGYRNVRLPNPQTGRWRTYKAHRLVWWWHHGEPPDTKQVDHIDGDKSNNTIGNLDLVTPGENIRRSYLNGRTRPWGPQIDKWRGRPRLTNEQKIEIVERRSTGEALASIADSYSISISHTHRVANSGEEVQREWH